MHGPFLLGEFVNKTAFGGDGMEKAIHAVEPKETAMQPPTG